MSPRLDQFLSRPITAQWSARRTAAAALVGLLLAIGAGAAPAEAAERNQNQHVRVGQHRSQPVEVIWRCKRYEVSISGALGHGEAMRCTSWQKVRVVPPRTAKLPWVLGGPPPRSWKR